MHTNTKCPKCKGNITPSKLTRDGVCHKCYRYYHPKGVPTRPRYRNNNDVDLLTRLKYVLYQQPINADTSNTTPHYIYNDIDDDNISCHSYVYSYQTFPRIPDSEYIGL